MNNIIQFRVARKKASTQVTQINSQIARKPAGRETQSIFVKIVREKIARAWWRGVSELDLANMYQVSRPEVERIVREELTDASQKGAA